MKKRLVLAAAALLFSGTAVQADYVMTNPQRLSRCAKAVGGVPSWKGGAQYWTTEGCRKGFHEIFSVIGEVGKDMSLGELQRIGNCRLEALQRFNAQNPARAVKPVQPYLSEMVQGCGEGDSRIIWRQLDQSRLGRSRLNLCCLF